MIGYMSPAKLLGTITLVVVIVSCTTTGQTAASPERPAAPEQSEPERSPSRENGPPILPIGGRESLMADLRPRDGSPVFLGVATRLLDREDEEPAAILHAAEQASRYVRMAAQYRFVAQRSQRSIGYLDDIDAQWDSNLADQLVSSMEVLESWRDEEGTYVLARTEGVPSAPPVTTIEIGGSGAEPRWVTQTPEIPGYLIGVGISQRSRRFRDSLDTADQEALKSVLIQAGATVRLIQDAQSVDRQGTREMVTSAEEAAATLRAFYVLARYASPDGRYYYSLVIAQEE